MFFFNLKCFNCVIRWYRDLSCSVFLCFMVHMAASDLVVPCSSMQHDMSRWWRHRDRRRVTLVLSSVLLLWFCGSEFHGSVTPYFMILCFHVPVNESRIYSRTAFIQHTSVTCLRSGTVTSSLSSYSYCEWTNKTSSIIYVVPFWKYGYYSWKRKKMRFEQKCW